MTELPAGTLSAISRASFAGVSDHLPSASTRAPFFVKPGLVVRRRRAASRRAARTAARPGLEQHRRVGRHRLRQGRPAILRSPHFRRCASRHVRNLPPQPAEELRRARPRRGDRHALRQQRRLSVVPSAVAHRLVPRRVLVRRRGELPDGASRRRANAARRARAAAARHLRPGSGGARLRRACRAHLGLRRRRCARRQQQGG